MQEDETDQRRVRIGLAFLTLTVVAAVIGAFTLKSTLGQTMMLGIAVFTIIRTYTIMRRVKRDQGR